MLRALLHITLREASQQRGQTPSSDSRAHCLTLFPSQLKLSPAETVFYTYLLVYYVLSPLESNHLEYLT